MHLSHVMIWTALDNLARDKNISTSRMAILSKLDATSFNKSKRFDHYGKEHWPSMETFAKVLDAMDVSWTDFARYFPRDKKRENEAEED